MTSRAKNIVKLTPEERSFLVEITDPRISIQYSADIIKKSKILLYMDIDGPTKDVTDREIAGLFCTRIENLSRLRKRFVKEGLKATVERKHDVLKTLKKSIWQKGEEEK